MTTKVSFNANKKGEFRKSLPAVKRQSFSCAGEGCIENENCIRWNRIYENLLLPQHLNIFGGK